jgi:hypothetical protein
MTLTQWSSATSGWVLLALLAVTIALPYLLRRRPGAFLRRMRPHFWAGFAVPVLTLAHLAPSMASPWIRTVNVAGLDLASLALLLVLAQVALGARLRRARTGRRSLRRAHLATMLGIAVLVAGHVALNMMLVS